MTDTVDTFTKAHRKVTLVVVARSGDAQDLLHEIEAMAGHLGICCIELANRELESVDSIMALKCVDDDYWPDDDEE